MTASKSIYNWLGKNALVLLFIILSVVIWVFTKLSNTYQSSVQIPIEIRSLPDSLSLQSVADVKLELGGSGLDLLRVHLFQDSIVLPFSSFIYEDKQLSLSPLFQEGTIRLQFPENIRLLQWNLQPNPLKVNPLKTKKIPLRWDVQLSFDPGYRLFDPLQITPDSIWVSGDAALLEGIDYWKIPTIQKEISSGAFSFKTTINPPEGITFSTSTINISGDALRYVEQSMNIDIYPLGLPRTNRIRLYPNQTRLVYQIPIEDAATFQENQVRVVADYGKRSVETLQLPLSIQTPPERFIPIRMEPEVVQYLIRKE